jgi:uncharacterized protein DUF6318
VTLRNRRALVASACLGALMLTGCNSNPEASRPFEPPQTTTAPSNTPPSPSATPSGPPDRPEAAKGLALSAAEAFVTHYVDLLNFAYATGDIQPLLSVSDRGCVGCNGTADYLRKTNGKNGGLTGDYKDRVMAVKELFRGASGRVGGSVVVRSGTYTERTAPTASPRQKPAHTETWQFTLSPVGGSWVMYEIQVEE